MADEQTSEQTQPEGGADERKFTQADVDRIVRERVARAKPADYDELREKAQRLSEVEKALKDAEEAAKRAREEARAEALAEVQRDRVMDKIEVAAAGKFRDLEDARLRLGGRASEFVTEQGEIDTEAIAKAVADVLESAPHLKAEEQSAPSRRAVGLGVKGGGSDKPDVKPGVGRLAAAYSNSSDR